MLLTKEVEVRMYGNNKKYYSSLGYDITKKFINVKAKHLHKNAGNKVKYKCLGCNDIFETQWCVYLNNKNKKCHKCSMKEVNSLNQEQKEKRLQEIIKKFKEKYPDRNYDFSETKYINKRTKFKVKCKCGNSFYLLPQNLLKGHGCSFCNKKEKSKKSYQKFIKKSIAKNGDIFDFSETEFKNYNTKIKLKCKKEGHEFYKLPRHILRGDNCPKCKIRATTLEQFVEKFRRRYPNKQYDFSQAKYEKSNKKIKIVCDSGHTFYTVPNKLLRGDNCPHCNIRSKGEEKIKDFLEKNNIAYHREKRFNGCRYKAMLRFDFYLPNYNLLIEYDGMQHFKKATGGWSKTYELTKKRDKIKNEFAARNDIDLLRISYTKKDFIENILAENLYLTD